MPRFEQVARCGFASGIILLGVLGLAFRDFALVWGGALPGWIPAPTLFVCLCALIPLIAGIALLFRRTEALASLVIVVYVLLWWLLIRVPPVIAGPLVEANWLECGMTGILLAGAWTLYARCNDRGVLGGERGIRLARICLGLALIPVGLSHLVYPAATVGFVPTWLPDRSAWGSFTGICHIAAGLALLTGVVARLAAQFETLMLAIFTVLVWVPALVSAPGTHSNWTEFWVSYALTAAAALVAVNIKVTPTSPQRG